MKREAERDGHMDPIFWYRSSETRPGQAEARGLSVAIQPNISVRGWPTDAGSKALAGFVALEDATVVERLRRAGACLCGSTHMAEFGLGLSGSQAGGAVQTGQADVELVLDFLGESRLAAARSGLFALKPSYGLISRYGLVGLIPSMECCGLLSKRPADIRTALAAMAGQDDRDFSLPEEPVPDFSPASLDPPAITVGFIPEAQGSLSPEQREGFGSVLDRLKATGMSVVELPLPDFASFSLIHRIVGSVEASSAAGRYDSVRYGKRAPGAKNWNEMYLLSRGAAFGTLVKSFLIQGAYFQFERYQAFEDACRIRGRLVREMGRLAAQADFLVLPLSDPGLDRLATPDSGLLSTTYATFDSTLFANVTGQPALYVLPPPGAPHPGFQVVGPRLSEGRLLAMAELLFGTTGRGGE